MAKCDLCGQDAGFLRKRHKECQQKYDTGAKLIQEKAQAAALASPDFTALEHDLSSVATASFIADTTLRALLAEAWQSAVLDALEDNVLSSEEERALVAFKDHFSLAQDELDSNGGYSRLVKAATIRDILEGKLPDRIHIQGEVPFNLQKAEKPVWVFQDVKYYEQRTRRKYVGGYQGVRIRIAKGVYYSTGGFRGNPVDISETVHIDTGLLGVTNKHLYFSGNTKAFRLRFDKIVSFVPYGDGIGVQRDALTAKPQVFITGDGWFTYNLLANLAQSQAT